MEAMFKKYCMNILYKKLKLNLENSFNYLNKITY